MEKVAFFGKRKETYSNIFIDLPHGLGDQVMCLPLFKSLKNKYPDAKITVFTPNSASRQLLELFLYVADYKCIDVKFTYGGVLWFFLKHSLSLRRFILSGRYDLYLAPHYNPLRGMFPKLFPFPVAILNKEHVHKVKGVENVLKALNVDVDYDYSLKPIPESEILVKEDLVTGEYVVLDLYPQHLQRDPRQWYYFDELIDRLCADGHKVVLVGLNPDHVQRDSVVDLVNKTTFLELLCLLKHAKLVVALDSGIFHFSYCLDTPVIGLFGPVDPSERLPVGRSKVFCVYRGIECSPCIVNKVDIPCINETSPYKCMKSIAADEVMVIIKEVLADEV